VELKVEKELQGERTRKRDDDGEWERELVIIGCN